MIPIVVAGLHPATGGSGQAACSLDMLLEALAHPPALAVARNRAASPRKLPGRMPK